MRESRQVASYNSLILTIQRRSLMAPGGSPEDLSNRRKPLKINDFQWLFFYTRPRFDAKYWNIRRA